jgi:O-antigen/teichoic acid export membrane protein
MRLIENRTFIPHSLTTLDHLFSSSAIPTSPAPVKSKRLALGGAIALADQVIVSFANFVTVVVLAKLCSDSVFGTFALAWQVINYVRTAQERLISAPYIAFAQQTQLDRRTWLGSSLTYEFIFSIVSSLALIVLSILLPMFESLAAFSTGLGALACALPWLLWRDHLRTVAFSAFRPQMALLMDGVGAILQLGGISLLAYSEQLTAINIAFVLGISSLIPAVLLLMMKTFPIRIETERLYADWLRSWGYSKWLVLSRCLGIGSYMVIPWMIAVYMGQADTGAFATCLNLVGLTTLFVVGLNNFFQPHTVRAYQDGGPTALKQSMITSGVAFTVAIVPLCIVFFFFGSQLLALIYKESFSKEGMVVFVLGLNVLCFSYAVVASNGLAAMQQSQGNFWGELSNLVVSVGLAFVLVPYCGLIGAALSILAGSFAATAMTIFAFYRISRNSTHLSVATLDGTAGASAT